MRPRRRHGAWRVLRSTRCEVIEYFGGRNRGVSVRGEMDEQAWKIWRACGACARQITVSLRFRITRVPAMLSEIAAAIGLVTMTTHQATLRMSS